MIIELKKIKVKDLYKGYINSETEGVVGFNGSLNIRPKYQREFVYADEQRNAVIKTVMNNFPLNTMYWVANEDGTFEVLDGQQRTISVCDYIAGKYSINYQYFFNLTVEKQEQILNYELQVYFCSGTDSEKLDWFRTINIAGVKLTEQELRNAVYSGPWLSDAKKYFSKRNCVASQLGGDYMSGSPIRQDYLETVIEWKSKLENISIEEYMARHQFDNNAAELWVYYQNVINWVKTIFPKVRSKMKGLNWGLFYNTYKNNEYNPVELEESIKTLMIDDDVTNKGGIYEYLLSGKTKEKVLNIRAFTESMALSAFELQEGVCPHCGKQYSFKEMEADHITPWSEGGKTTKENCQMLCKNCNRTKSNK